MTINKTRTISTLTGLLLAAGGAVAGLNGDAAPQDVLPGSLANNQSAGMCTVAINSTGTIAGGGGYLSSATLLGTGSYEVIFKGPCGGNITAEKGWARFVQVDTLTGGAVTGGMSCTTADRVGNTAGVYVYCTNAAGTPTNTSFFLSVMR